MLEELLTIIAASTASAGIVIFLARALVTHLLSKDVALYKHQLERESEHAIEGIRSSFRGRELIHQKLHERRIEVIPEMHAFLVDALAAIQPCVTAMCINDHEQRQQAYQHAFGPIDAFSVFFKKNRIWLTPGLAKQLETFNSERVDGLTQRFVSLLDLEKRGLGKDWVYKEIGPYWEKVNKEAPIEMIEKEFRKVLGIVEKDSPAKDSDGT